MGPNLMGKQIHRCFIHLPYFLQWLRDCFLYDPGSKPIGASADRVLHNLGAFTHWVLLLRRYPRSNSMWTALHDVPHGKSKYSDVSFVQLILFSQCFLNLSEQKGPLKSQVMDQSARLWGLQSRLFNPLQSASSSESDLWNSSNSDRLEFCEHSVRIVPTPNKTLTKRWLSRK